MWSIEGAWAVGEFMNRSRLSVRVGTALTFLLAPSSLLAADKLLIHGHIYTGNPRAPWAQALAITGTRIEAGDIRTLESVVKCACQREVGTDCLAVMLAGDNVVDLKRQERQRLRHLAVFTAVLGALPDKTDKRFIHSCARPGGCRDGERRGPWPGAGL